MEEKLIQNIETFDIEEEAQNTIELVNSLESPQLLNNPNSEITNTIVTKLFLIKFFIIYVFNLSLKYKRCTK